MPEPGDSSNLLELVQRPVIWRDKWEQYLSSGVMPKHTCQLVTNLLKATLCGDDRDVSDAEDEDKNGNETVTDRRAPPPLSAEEAKVVLGNADMACSTTAPKKKQKHAAALRTVEEVWGRVSESVAEGRQTKTVPLEECEAHLRARGAEEQACSRRLAAAQKEARLTIYPSRSNIHLRQWLADLQDRTMAPTQQQAALLEAVVSRLQAEAREEHATGRINAESPSMRHLVLGVPGSGKSLLIGWLREAFDSVLGWVHGCQYVALAMQNCMAADIQGVTFHHYMGLQIGELQRALPDRQKFATQNQFLRFVLIDEVSMVPAEMLGLLELSLSDVSRRRVQNPQTYFGNMNIVAFGDFWQIPPVSGTSLCSNPRRAGTMLASHGLELIWATEDTAERDIVVVGQTPFLPLVA